MPERRGSVTTENLPTEPEAQYPRRTPGATLEQSQNGGPTGEHTNVVPLNGNRSANGTGRSTKPSVVPPGRKSVFEDGGRPDTSALAQQRVEQGRPSMVASKAPTSIAMPSLPETAPSFVPSTADSATDGPSTGDLNALRSAQAKASRQQRQGKVFGRSMLAVILIAGMVAGALKFGRPLLFPTEWDEELIPIVSEIETEQGVEFAEPVAFVRTDQAELAQRALESTSGTDWVDQVPQWRALGLATGEPTIESVGSAIVGSASVWYDSSTNTIYALGGERPAGADVEEADGTDEETEATTPADGTTDPAAEAEAAELKVLLQTIFERQIRGGQFHEASAASEGFAGPSSPASLAERSVDGFLFGNRTAPPVPQSGLPAPIAHELLALDGLGQPIVEGSDIDPDTLTPGTEYPATITEALDVTTNENSSALLRSGDVPLVGPVAIGADEWSLVWGMRLPTETVDRLIGVVTADSYRATERQGVVCVSGAFKTSTPSTADEVEAAMQLWAAAAPAGSGATVARVSPSSVQLDACDPGPDANIVSNPSAPADLVARQVARVSR